MSGADGGGGPGRGPGSAPDGEAGPVARLFARPSVRCAIALVVVSIGTVLAVVGLFTTRYGLLVAGIVVVGLGAAFGPGRIRR